MHKGSKWGAVGVAAALVASGLLAALDAPVVAAAGKECSDASWTGGTTEWCRGTFTYRDYVYDDTGADSIAGSPFGTPLNRATGDVDHTAHGQTRNSADLLTLTMTRVGRRVDVGFLLNTLTPTDGTLAAIALDLDGDPATGGGAWANGIGATSAGHDVVHVFDTRDAGANTITGSFTVPKAVLASRRSVRVQAVVALADGTVMNVAFRGQRETGSWWEGTQSAALQAGDLSAFGADVVLADLGQAAVHRPAPPAYGFLERIYRSDVTIPRTAGETEGEGIADPAVPGRASGRFGNDGFSQSYGYLGHHQPYGVYVPAPDGTRYGLQLALHGLNAAHASLVNGAGLQRRFGDDLHRIVAVPLGRGAAGGYSDHSERDVLDVIADLRATYPVDSRKIFSGGYSMGGGGAYRMALQHPDLFAGIVSWVGFSGDCLNGTGVAPGDPRDESGPWGPVVEDTFPNDPSTQPGCPTTAIGNMIQYFDNFRYLPTAMLYSVADELVWINHDVAVIQRFQQLGYEHVNWTHAAEHLTFAVLDDWAKEARWTAGRVRPTTVSRVTFKTNPWLWNPDLGLVSDGAWWVDDMVPADRGLVENWAPGTVDMKVDLLSDACPVDTYTIRNRIGAGLDPVPWVSTEGVRIADPASPRANRIRGTMANVASLTIDAKTACLDPSRPLVLDVATDVPSTLTIDWGRRTEVVQLG